MIYGYARVSTAKQIKGNSLEEQKQELINKNCPKENIVEESYTGTTMYRPKFKELISKLQRNDTLMVTKLDRFARTVNEGNEIINQLLEKGVNVHILNMGFMDNTPNSKMIRTLFLAFAEYERDMIIERTQAGRAKAKELDPIGFAERDGRPQKFSKTQQQHAINLIEKEHISYKEVSQMLNISESTLYRIMRNHRAKKITETNK